MSNCGWTCSDCGHYRHEHEPAVSMREPGKCHRTINDGTDKGTLLCGCEGWR